MVRPAFPNRTFLLQIMANDVAKGRYKTSPSRVFNFEEIREAYRVMEANETKGTMVVVRNENQLLMAVETWHRTYDRLSLESRFRAEITVA